jgi:murein DD-endopeptidase MepM/ murein hydrolase activator NlpD
MSANTLHISPRAVRLGATALLASAALAAMGAPSARPSSTSGAASESYGWPVKPFDRQHPVRGNFGDPRTVFTAPPTLAGVLRGAGQFTFHEGVDIAAPNGTAVYRCATAASSWRVPRRPESA